MQFDSITDLIVHASGCDACRPHVRPTQCAPAMLCGVGAAIWFDTDEQKATKAKTAKDKAAAEARAAKDKAAADAKTAKDKAAADAKTAKAENKGNAA